MRMLRKSVEMYDRLQNEEGMQFDWKQNGIAAACGNTGPNAGGQTVGQDGTQL